MKATILVGDVLDWLRDLPDESVQCVVTSPPYWGLRDYGTAGQLGLEKTPEEYIARMVEVFREVRRVLRNDGTLWLNMGDCYARNGGTPGGGNRELLHMEGNQSRMLKIPDGCGLKEKDLVGIPWMLAFALRADGWYLRQDIIWSKPNPMPESVTDRCTKAHEYLFLLTKSARYYCDMEAILELCSPNTNPCLSQDLIHQIGSEPAHAGGKTNGNMKAVRRKAAAIGSGNKNNPSFTSAVCLPVTHRNKRSVWEIATQPYAEAHFATFPEKLVEPCILAGSKEGDTVLDPFCGSGTTGAVALRYHRDFVGIELNPAYAELARKRIGNEAPMFNQVEISFPAVPADPIPPQTSLLPAPEPAS